jgi:hypothetical protein
VNWTVSTSLGSLQSYGDLLRDLLNLKASNMTTEIITVPADYLAEATYYISLSLTIFLGQTASTTVSFIYGGSVNTPLVNIIGPSQLTIYPINSLSISVNATFSSCISNMEISTMNFTWIVSSNGKQTNITSQSNSQRTFYLTAYRLSASTIYTVSCIVTIPATTRYSSALASASVTVNVLSGNVIALINDGHAIAISSDKTFDASSSYDENSSGGNRNLLYQWSCTYVSLVDYGKSCNVIFTNSSSLSSSKVTVSYSKMYTTKTYQVGVVVSSADGRYASTSVVVTRLNVTAETASIQIVSPSLIVNYNQYVTLTSFIQSYAGTALASWSATIGTQSVSLASASTSTAYNFTALTLENGVSYQLRISAGSFLMGSTVTFQLSVLHQSIVIGLNSIDITINGPPSGGTIVASPKTGGIGFNTTFYFLASGWSDDQSAIYPLTYDLRYRVSAKKPYLILQGMSYASRASGQLPTGLAAVNYQVTISLRIYDYYEANASTTTTVQVNSAAAFNPTQYLTNNLAVGYNSSNTDQILSTINNVVTYVAAVNCSGVNTSYCNSLYRDECYQTANTCGSCQSGYVGIVGNSNQVCVETSLASIYGDIGSSCNQDTDCLYGECSNNICTEPQQECPTSIVDSECSGHGSCEYKINGQVANGSSCGITNTYCYLSCVCSSGYYGADCLLSESDRNSYLTTYISVCNALSVVQNISESSTDLLDNLASTLSLVTAGLKTVTTGGIEECNTILEEVLTLAGSGYLATSTLDTANYLTQSLSDIVNPGNSSSTIDDSVSNIARGVLEAMANGETAIQLLADKLQLEIRRDIINEFANTKLTFPQTLAEQQYNVSAPTIQFVNDGGKYCGTTSGYIRFSSGKWIQSPYRTNNSSSLSSTLRTEVYANPSFTSPVVNYSRIMYYYTIPFATAQTFTNYSILELFLNPNLTNSIPNCQYYDDGEYMTCTNCKIDTYNSLTVTYACYDITEICDVISSFSTLVKSNIETSSSLPNTQVNEDRYLLSLSGDDDGAQLQTPNANIKQVSAILSLAIEGITLILSANPFSIDINEAKPVIAFISCLMLIFVVGCIGFNRWDQTDYWSIRYHAYTQKSTSQKSSKSSKTFILKPMENMMNSIRTRKRLLRHINYQQQQEKVALLLQHFRDILSDALPLGARQWRKKGMALVWKAILKHHPMTSIFYGASLTNRRFVRFIKAFSDIGYLLFVDTLFFGIFYADQGTCEAYDTESACLHPMNAATGSQLCSWGGTTAPILSSTSSHTILQVGKCSLVPPPNNLTFTMLLTALTIIVGLPLQIFLDFILVEICAKEANWESFQFFLYEGNVGGFRFRRKQNVDKTIDVDLVTKHIHRNIPTNTSTFNTYSRQDDDQLTPIFKYLEFQTDEDEAYILLRAMKKYILDCLSVTSNPPPPQQQQPQQQRPLFMQDTLSLHAFEHLLDHQTSLELKALERLIETHNLCKYCS